MLILIPAIASAQTALPADQSHGPSGLYDMVEEAVVRLPLAALLGAALAMRPKRRGTPKREPAVIHTQIILAIVGAAIMLVVGASLARAFGIVGAANLIRYRSKIDDPKGRRCHALRAGGWAGGGRRVSMGLPSSRRSSSWWLSRSSSRCRADDVEASSRCE